MNPFSHNYIIIYCFAFFKNSLFTSKLMYYLFFLFFKKVINLEILFNEAVEAIWTLFPMIMLLFIALPSLKILYLMESTKNIDLSFKILGHQWFWSYEYSDFEDIEFSSYMLDSMNYLDQFRCLDVDNRVVLPININIRGVVSSTDVIHSWTVPSLGVKIDATPGMLNQIMFNANKIGLFYGQCSEICGSLHSFMPICVEIVDINSFFNWLKNFSN
uniref:Cytochrome c oxidase subunit 2 n=1 Tax=Macrogyropus costalimai TaxID=1941320 RepID=A0A7S5WUQ8_9NEOP|nr:cytochrome c oxidase subunit 2 [Macrogyropus costalimai]